MVWKLICKTRVAPKAVHLGISFFGSGVTIDLFGTQFFRLGIAIERLCWLFYGFIVLL